MTFGRVRIGIGLLFLLLLLFLADEEGVFFLFLAAAALHELGHVAAVYMAGGHVRALCLDLFGGNMQVEARLSYPRELFVTAAGPGLNLLAAYLASTAARVTPLGNTPAGDALYLFSGICVLLGGFNLLPVRPLDGGELLYTLTAWRADSERAERVCGIAGAAVSAVLIAAGIFILIKTKYNITMLAAGLFTLPAAVRGVPFRRHTRRKA